MPNSLGIEFAAPDVFQGDLINTLGGEQEATNTDQPPEPTPKPQLTILTAEYWHGPVSRRKTTPVGTTTLRLPRARKVTSVRAMTPVVRAPARSPGQWTVHCIVTCSPRMIRTRPGRATCDGR
jgi:hypothetical protein